MTNSIDKGHKLGNEGRNIAIRKGDFKLKFDHIIKTKSGHVCGVATRPRNEEEIATPTLGKEVPVDVNHFHNLLGHFGEDKTRAVAKCCGVELSGKFKPCSDCAKAKAKQANVPKFFLMKKGVQFLENVCFLTLVPSSQEVLVVQNFGC